MRRCCWWCRCRKTWKMKSKFSNNFPLNGKSISIQIVGVTFEERNRSRSIDDVLSMFQLIAFISFTRKFLFDHRSNKLRLIVSLINKIFQIRLMSVASSSTTSSKISTRDITKSSEKINKKIKGAVRNIYLLFNKKITFIMARKREKLKNWFSLLRSEVPLNTFAIFSIVVLRHENIFSLSWLILARKRVFCLRMI